MDPMFFKTAFSLFWYFWQRLMLKLVQHGCLMERRLLHLPSLGAAGGRAQHLFLVGTQAHTTCVCTWLATGINTEKEHLLKHKQHRWPDPIPFSGWWTWKPLSKNHINALSVGPSSTWPYMLNRCRSWSWPSGLLPAAGLSVHTHRACSSALVAGTQSSAIYICMHTCGAENPSNLWPQTVCLASGLPGLPVASWRWVFRLAGSRHTAVSSVNL